jgi:hypothetical protein
MRVLPQGHSHIINLPFNFGNIYIVYRMSYV